MIYEIEISEHADIDLRGIYEYIAFELKSPDNAKGQLMRLENSIMNLEKMPERFPIYDNEVWKNKGLHIMSVDNYCVLYILDIECRLVSILRVMYEGRDIDNQLKKYMK